MKSSTLKAPENKQKSSIQIYSDEIEFEEGEATNPSSYIWNHQLGDKYEFLHFHHCVEFGICLEGSGVWHINGNTIPFNGPTYSLIMPGIFHSAHSTYFKDCIWNFLYVKDVDLLSDFSLNGESLMEILKNEAFIVSKRKDPVVFNLIESFINIASQNIKDKKIILSNLLKTIFIMKCKDKGVDTNEQKDLTPIIPAINYINLHYMDKIDLNYLADLCCCSKSTLRRYFLNSTNKSPYQFIENVRLNISKGMLRTNKKIVNIALDCGYPSISCYNKKFKSVYGLSPKEYRIKHKKS